MFPGPFDNFQRGLPIRVRRNGMQDYDRPIIRARGRPIEAVPVRSVDGTPGFRLVDGRDFCCGQRVRTPRRRFVDIMEDERATRLGITRGHRDFNTGDEDSRATLDLFDELSPPASPEPQKRPETRGNGTQSRIPAFASQRASNAQEHQLGTTTSPHSTTASELQDSQLKSGSLKEGLPFGKAMKWLHEETEVAIAFYNEFEAEFGAEVERLTYADKKMQKKLWTMKLAGKRSDPNQNMPDKPAEKWGKLFSEQKRSLCVAMEAVLNATLSLRDKNSPKPVALEVMKRLQQKVDTVSRQIVDLLNSAAADREHCKVLLGELGFLKWLVDPKKEENKTMLEEGGGANDGGDQAEQQQAESWDSQLL